MPTPSLVEELIQLAQREATPLPELLRRTRVLAAKLKIPELEDWVKKETSGYTGQFTEIPEYRRVSCQLLVLNIVQGRWTPILVPEATNLAKLFGTVGIHQSAAEIERLLESSDAATRANVSHYEHDLLSEHIPQLARMQVVRSVPNTSFKGVLEAIRNRVLEAILELDAKGVRGEGLSFSEEEKTKAAAVTTHIVNHIYGDNANVASAAHSPNSGMAFVSGGALINQHIGNIQQGNQELASAFKNVLETLKTDDSLDAAKRAEAEQQLTFLADQAAKPEQQRQPLAVIKSVFSGVGQVAALSANLSKVWGTFGPVISGYLAG